MLRYTTVLFFFFFFSSRRRHTRFDCDWSSDVCSSDLESSYSKAAASYLQMMREQTETPAVSLQRYMVENYHANIRTYAASRCVSRDDPGLPRGLRAK